MLYLIFFIHAWINEDNVKYNVSPWRHINENEKKLINSENVKNDLIKLYNPIKYEFEKSIDNFDIKNMNNSIAYKNITRDCIKNNINNTISQIYTRNKVRNLLNEHINLTNTKYDSVISARIDIFTPINIYLKSIYNNYTYVCNLHGCKNIFPDNFCLFPQSVYLKLFNMYYDLEYILFNNDLNNKMILAGVTFEINMEQLIYANYLLHFNTDDIIYTNMIDYSNGAFAS